MLDDFNPDDYSKEIPRLSHDTVDEQDRWLSSAGTHTEEDANDEIIALKHFNVKKFLAAPDTDLPLKILLCDDMIFNLEALKIQIQALGIDLEAQVHTAENGLQALAQVKN